jgi:CBS domain containing-hemolysin-like protein
MLTIFYILLVFLFFLANGFFVASEFALVGVRRSRILTLAKAGNRRFSVRPGGASDRAWRNRRV